jgi:ketosteroid isomerase-like protein
MSIKNALASVPVRNLAAAVQWYEKLFGRPPEPRHSPDVAEWKFEMGGWLQVYQNAQRAGSGSFSLTVSSLAEHVAAFKTCGLETDQQMTTEKFKLVMLKDPDDNSIAFVEALAPTAETRISGIIRACYSAYEKKDRLALEKLLHDDFTFSSPHDPHLDRAAYFERCWPNSKNTSAFDIQSLIEGDGEAFVLYECTPLAGEPFSNTEHFCVDGDKIRKVRVFYGSLPKK